MDNSVHADFLYNPSHESKGYRFSSRLAEEVNAPLTTANAARQAYRMAGKLGYDNSVFAAIFEALHDP